MAGATTQAQLTGLQNGCTYTVSVTATNQAGNTYVFELPFVTLDRERDMRVAYDYFEQRLADRS